jgi:hypothetical protein
VTKKLNPKLCFRINSEETKTERIKNGMLSDMKRQKVSEKITGRLGSLVSNPALRSMKQTYVSTVGRQMRVLFPCG